MPCGQFMHSRWLTTLPVPNCCNQCRYRPATHLRPSFRNRMCEFWLRSMGLLVHLVSGYLHCNRKSGSRTTHCSCVGFEWMQASLFHRKRRVANACNQDVNQCSCGSVMAWAGSLMLNYWCCDIDSHYFYSVSVKPCTTRHTS